MPGPTITAKRGTSISSRWGCCFMFFVALCLALCDAGCSIVGYVLCKMFSAYGVSLSLSVSLSLYILYIHVYTYIYIYMYMSIMYIMNKHIYIYIYIHIKQLRPTARRDETCNLPGPLPQKRQHPRLGGHVPPARALHQPGAHDQQVLSRSRVKRPTSIAEICGESAHKLHRQTSESWHVRFPSARCTASAPPSTRGWAAPS